MLDPDQDRVLQDLAKSIAMSVNTLGADCTARLLGNVALGLADNSETEVVGRLSRRDQAGFMLRPPKNISR